MGAGLSLPAAADAGVEFGRAVIGETVQGRVQKGYEPIGIRAGSFMFLPTLDVRGEYNDNIYADRTAKVDDFIVGIRPQIAGHSLWERHSLTMSAYGNFGIFADNSSEDYQDAGVSTETRIDIAEHSQLTASLAAHRDHERRDSPDDARGVNPTIFYQLNPELRFDQRVNRMAFRIKGSVDYLDFDDAVSGTGAIINQDDRDRLIWTLEGRAGYDVSDNVQLYVSGLMDHRTYDEQFDDDGVERDSSGFGVFGGIIVELTGTISAEAYLGYRDQSFKDAGLLDVNGVAGGINVIWAPTKLTTVTITGERTVEETTILGSTASLNTSFEVKVDHELRRNIVLSLSAAYLNRQYEGIDRDDDNFRGSVGLQYLISRHFRLRAGYSYNSRRSEVFADGFDINSAYVNLHVEY